MSKYVCDCMCVSKKDIEEGNEQSKLAGKGCGGCVSLVEKLRAAIAKLRGQKDG